MKQSKLFVFLITNMTYGITYFIHWPDQPEVSIVLMPRNVVCQSVNRMWEGAGVGLDVMGKKVKSLPELRTVDTVYGSVRVAITKRTRSYERSVDPTKATSPQSAI